MSVTPFWVAFGVQFDFFEEKYRKSQYGVKGRPKTNLCTVLWRGPYVNIFHEKTKIGN